jgi:hypothetical protein
MHCLHQNNRGQQQCKALLNSCHASWTLEEAHSTWPPQEHRPSLQAAKVQHNNCALAEGVNGASYAAGLAVKAGAAADTQNQSA